MESRLHQAARWYARHGYAIFPLRANRKEPAVKEWQHVATTDIEQVDRWWRNNPAYNIGINCGASDIVVLDFDTYKSGIRTDALFDDDELLDAVLTRTPHGGTHVWFRQPYGIRLTNAVGNLPKHVDVRGHGGYIIAPPSVVECNLAYIFVDEHRPSDFPELPQLPQPVVELITSGALANCKEVHFTADLPCPELGQWRLSRTALGLIGEGAPKGERSEADFRVCISLIRAGADDNEIRAVFQHYAIGAKYREQGDKYLARTVGRARAWCEANPLGQENEQQRQQLERLRAWVSSPACVKEIKDRGIARATGLAMTLAELVKHGSLRVKVSGTAISECFSVSRMTVWRRLQKLDEIGMVKLEGSSLVDLTPALSFTNVTLSHNSSSNTPDLVESVTFVKDDFQAAHVGDDAFTSYPYAYAVARRGGEAPLMCSLGETGWLLWPHFEAGGTAQEIADASGMSVTSVHYAARRFIACGLMEEDWADHRRKYYQLVPDAEARLDAVRPHMVTFGVGMMRMGRNKEITANYAAFRLRRRKHMDAREIAWWENLRDDSDRAASILYDILQDQGFDARMKVGKDRAIRQRVRNRYDHGEMWRTWGRPLFDNWNRLGDVSFGEKIRQLTLARVPTADATVFKRVRAEVREEVEMMLAMAPKRVRYETVDEDYYQPPTTPQWKQLELLGEVPHG